MHRVGQEEPPWIASMVYMAGESIDQRERLDEIVRDVLDALGATSAEIQAMSVTAGMGREQAFDWATLASLLALPDASTLTIRGRGADAGDFSLKLHLRHNPEIPLEYQHAGVWRLVAQAGPDPAGLQRAADAALALVTGCAAALPVLHGGVTLLPSFDQALTEVSLTGVAISEQPPAFVERWHFDASMEKLLWQKARRVYWTTLLGPEIARQAGGAEAARAAGAAEVREIGGSLLIRATEHVTDVMESEFSARVSGLTRWLWPHLIQNPADAPRS